MLQGNIAAWLKKIGDKISPGDAIAELETDKVPLLHICGNYAIAYYVFIRCVLDLAAAPLTRIATGHTGIRGCGKRLLGRRHGSCRRQGRSGAHHA